VFSYVRPIDKQKALMCSVSADNVSIYLHSVTKLDDLKEMLMRGKDYIAKNRIHP